MSTGSIRSTESSPGGSVVSVIYSSLKLSIGERSESSDIQETNVLGVAGDEASACLDVLAHQDREQLVGGSGVVEGDLTQHPDRGVHGGFPQLLGIHFAETLVALDAVFLIDLLAGLLPRLQQTVPFPVGVGEFRIAALPLQLVQRRLCQEYVSVLDERSHEPEQQRQQQRRDVLAVDVGVGHQHDLVVTQLGEIE